MLQGVGEAIAGREVPKVLLLNGSHDRETSAGLKHGGLMAAADVVKAICSALNRDHDRNGAGLRNAPSAYVTAMLVPRGGAIAVDRTSLAAIGIRCAVRHQLVPKPQVLTLNKSSTAHTASAPVHA